MKNLAVAAALSLAYFASAELGHLLSIGSPGFATFWPASGVALGALLLSRRRDWPLRIFAILLANTASDMLVHGRSAPVALAFCLGNASEAAVSAILFQRFAARRPSLARVRDVVGLIAIPALSGAALAASIGTAAVQLAHGVDSIGWVWLAWWIADLLGILTVAPVFLAFARGGDDEPLRRGNPARAVEAGVLLAGLAAVGELILRTGSTVSRPLPFFGIPFLLWAALRLGRRGASLAMLALMLIAVGDAALSQGSAALAIPPLSFVLLLQAFLVTLSASFLILGAVLAERDHARRTLLEQAAELRRFAQAVESATDGIAMAAPTGEAIYHNRAFVAHLGYTVEELNARGGPAALFADPNVARELDEAARDLRPWAGEVDVRARDGRLVPVRFSRSVVAGSDGKGAGLLAILTMIEERRRREQRRSIEYEITRILAAASSVDDAAPELLRCSCTLLGWDEATLWFLDPEADVLRAACSYTRDERLRSLAQRTKELTFRPGVGPGRAVDRKKAVWVEDVSGDTESALPADIRACGVQAALAVPIRAGGDAVGVLGFLSLEKKRRDPDLLQVMDSIGLQIGLLVQRSRTMQALRAARELAQAASQAKSDFLANVSHEIRTPLNAVLGMLELLSGTRLDPAQRRYVEVASSSGHALATLIADVLDFSRIEAGKLDLDEAPLDVRRLVADVVEALRPLAEAKGLAIAIEEGPSVAPAYLGDAARLRQILTNLVDNAIKFTSEGKVSVSLGAAPSGGDSHILRCEVMDTGIGVPPAHRETIFGSFEQGDPTITRRYGGTGLGLAISRRLVELMGGHITVDSEVGRGSTFSFAVRLRKAPDGDLAEPPPPPSIGPSALPRLKVLVFEDSPVNREVVRGVLERDGHAVVLREDATCAVEAVLVDEPDIILMDLQMPGVSGFDATRQIRKAERLTGRKIPIIALTARALEHDRERCFASGMDGYVAKPFRLATLRREMAFALAALPPRPPEQPAPAPKEVVLDEDALIRLAAGDATFLRRLAETFERERAASMEALRRAAASEGFDALEDTAHRLKSAAGSLGGRRAHAAAHRVEEMGRSRSAHGLAEELARLDAELSSLSSAMSALVAAQEPA